MKKNILLTLLALFTALTSSVFAQNRGRDNTADKALTSVGRVNPSTLALEIEIPLANYPGRGVSVPVTLNYSSKIWRLMRLEDSQDPGHGNNMCRRQYSAMFSENAAAGWTTSVTAPVIDYVGSWNFYSNDGEPTDWGFPTCREQESPDIVARTYIRRVIVRLPGGETHELRASDTPVPFLDFTTDPNSPTRTQNWDAVFYAVDGSNIRYIQDSNNGVYRLLLPDGSKYDFETEPQFVGRRRSVRFSDVNGNQLNYQHGEDANGPTTITDTIGREIAAPFGLNAPATPTNTSQPQTYQMPGYAAPHRFHWKRLKGANAAESALTDFNQPLKNSGDTYACGPTGNRYCFHTRDEALFVGYGGRVISRGLFNPVVLTAIELPDGQTYRFSYDVYGRIDRIEHPTGGVETFKHEVIPTLANTDPSDPAGNQTNFGVVERKMLQSNSHPPLLFTYSAELIGGAYRVVVNEPDGKRFERLLYGGYESGAEAARYGNDESLAGMAYDEMEISAAGRLLQRTETTWTRTIHGGLFHWHPRVLRRKTTISDEHGNSIVSATAFDYGGDLNRIDEYVRTIRTSEFPFHAASAAAPSVPDRVTETLYLIDDDRIPTDVRESYRRTGLAMLASATMVGDGNGRVASRKEFIYDGSGYSPGRRGLITTTRFWDSERGSHDNPQAYTETHSRYDEFGNETEVHDGRGNVTYLQYDDEFNAFPVRKVSPIPDADGSHGSATSLTTSIAYNKVVGIPVSSTDANGIETRHTYDYRNLKLLSSEVYVNDQPRGSRTQHEYQTTPNDYRLITRSERDTNRWDVETVFLNAWGQAIRTVKESSEGQIIVEREFDIHGRERRITLPYFAGETPVWSNVNYDEAGRISEIRSADGGTVTRRYGVLISDLVGTTETVTDQAGKKRTYVKDALGRMIRTIEDPLGGVLISDFTYDVNDQLRLVKQGTQRRYFAYDSLRRLIFSRIPESDPNPALSHVDSITGNSEWSTRYEYDAAGNLARTTDARGVVATNFYDSLNRLLESRYSDGTPTVTNFYDGRLPSVGGTAVNATGSALGTLTGVTNSVGSNSNTHFDVLGRVTESRQITAGQTFNFHYAYNLTELISVTYPNGRTVKSDMNNDGRFARISGTIGGIERTYLSGLKYDAEGRLLRHRLGNGKWEATNFNGRGQMTAVQLGASAGAGDILRLEFDYGIGSTNNGNLLGQRVKAGDQGQVFVQNYSYDNLNRLISATETVGAQTEWQQSFSYDRFGNRTVNTGSTAFSLGTPKVVSPVASSANNRLIPDQDGDGIVDYRFDKNGNLIRDAENRRFVYDAGNRLTQYFEPGNNSSVADGEYLYDGTGRRVMKKTSHDTTIFVYDAQGRLASEYSSAPVASPSTTYLTTDHLGSARVLTNELGAVVSRRDFGPFGEKLVTTNRSMQSGYRPDDIRKGYTGYERDEETKLEFAQARYYSSSFGRFTSVDPLGTSATVSAPQTFNRYSYAINSPYKYNDPLGLFIQQTDSMPDEKRRKKKAKIRGRIRATPHANVVNKTDGRQPANQIVVSARVLAMAKQTHDIFPIRFDDTETINDVIVPLPKDLIEFKIKLATMIYATQASVTIKINANMATGSTVPKTVTTEQQNSVSQGTTTTGGGEVSISSQGVAAGGSGSQANSTGQSDTSGQRQEGESLDLTAQQNNLEVETKTMILNFINENADERGNIPITYVDNQNRSTLVHLPREMVEQHLRKFATDVKSEAFKDTKLPDRD